jgi:hypothetical protein
VSDDDNAGDDESTNRRESGRSGGPTRPGSDALRSAAQSAVAGAGAGAASAAGDGPTRQQPRTRESDATTETATADAATRLRSPSPSDDDPPNRLPLVLGGVIAVVLVLGAFALFRPGSGGGSGQAIDTENRIQLGERGGPPVETTTTEATTTTTEATTTTTTEATTTTQADEPGPIAPPAGGDQPAPTVAQPAPTPPPTPSTTSSTAPPSPAQLTVTYPRDAQDRMVLFAGGSSAVSIYNSGGQPGNYAVSVSGDVAVVGASSGAVQPGQVVSVNIRAGDGTDGPPPHGFITVGSSQGTIVTIPVHITGVAPAS